MNALNENDDIKMKNLNAFIIINDTVTQLNTF